MSIYSTLNETTDMTRHALHKAYSKARAAGDNVEMARLSGLAAELDALRRKLALGALSDAVAAVEAIKKSLSTKTGGTTGGSTDDTAGQGEATTGGGTTEEEAKDTGTSDTATDDVVVPGPEKMAWGAVTLRKHGAAFNAKVRGVAGRLGIDPNYLMAAMAFETAETFSPSIRNGAGSGATGLIQFMPSTARRLGTSTAKLARMTAIDQLDYVEKYFRTATRRRLRTLSDIYMAILWPVAVGKAESHVLFRRPSRAYSQNRGFDVNKDGLITKAEAAAKVQQKLVKGMKDSRIG